MLRLAQAALTLRQEEQSRFFHFSWPRLGAAAAALADRMGASLMTDSKNYEFASAHRRSRRLRCGS